MISSKTYSSYRTVKLFSQCRKASTRNVKKGVKNHNNAPSPKPPNTKRNALSDQNKHLDLTTQTWVIEPRIPFLQAKLRTPTSPVVILMTVGFALSSIYLTSTAFPDPSAPPPSPSVSSSSTAGSQPESQESTITSTLLYPITFVFRPLFVDESVIDDSKKSWRYKAGFAAGLASIFLFTVSHLKGPRYVRYISISPKNTTPVQSVGSASGQTAVGSGAEAGGGAIMQIYPAFSRHCVTHPVSRSVLVSPLLNEKERVLSTVRILGAPRSIGKVGWGVNMFGDGALVNGKVMDTEEVVKLMERIWVAHGGKITVA